MKVSRRNFLILLALIGVVLIFFKLGTYARAFVGKIRSNYTIQSKNGVQVPEDAYHWELTDGGQRSYKYEEFKGKVVVLNFWASWCRPCIEEMPSLQGLYDQYGDKVSFLFVAQDDKEKVEALMKKRGFTIPVSYSKTSVPDLFFTKTIPTTYIMDKNGLIVLATSESKDWNTAETHELLDRLLEE